MSMSSTPVPDALGEPTIVQAIWEVRFRLKHEGVADALPGLFFSRFRDTFTDLQKLPAAAVPLELRRLEPALKYQPTHQLVRAERQVQLGPEVLGHSWSSQYPGWKEFEKKNAELIEFLRETDLVAQVERTSLRYVNLLVPPKNESQLEQLRVRLEMLERSVSESSTYFRTESSEGGLTTVIQLRTGASRKGEEGTGALGLLFDIDVIANVSADDFWNTANGTLNNVHDRIKDVFFGTLTQRTLERLKPRWGEK